jgi:osmotically inducible lipoprotein OsmB
MHLGGTILGRLRFQGHTREREKEKMTRTNAMKKWMLCAIAATGLALSACGTSPGDRAVSGGLIGAGAGAAIGAAAGDPAAGALIGGVGGAAVGALSDPCTLNLGDPWWDQHGGRREYERRCGRR